MSKITALYYLGFKYKKTLTEIPSSRWIMKKEVKDTNILEFITVWQPNLS